LLDLAGAPSLFSGAKHMDEQLYKPIWVKVVLGFALVLTGLLLTLMMYKFFPVPKEPGFDGMGALRFVFMGLGLTLALYVVGVILVRNYPYRIFLLCLMLFFGILVFVRYMVIGY
jgi:hypothetical protein